MLARLLLEPGKDWSVSQLAHAADTSLPTATREVARFEDAGLVRTIKRGNTRYVQVLTDHPVYRPLADLMAVTFGPAAVLRGVLADVPGIEQAFIYGSWAARYEDVPGGVPGDIDVLVLGAPDHNALDEAVGRAEDVLGREVNVRQVEPSAWADDDSGFKRTVLTSPKISVVSQDTPGDDG